MEKRNIHQVLANVQREINVPKDQYNSFGKYKYRNLESINRVAKQVCEIYNCGYYLTDEIVAIPGSEQRVTLVGKGQEIVQADVRYYVKATAVFFLCEHDVSEPRATGTITSTAYAREEAFKTGMDDAQVSGLASSYARKYALCGLFAIDSGEEVDAMDNTSQSNAQKAKPTTSHTKESKHDRKSALRGSEELMLAATKFADMTGKTVDDVMQAVEATDTMRNIEAPQSAADYDDNQSAIAAKIIQNWIERRMNA